MTYCVPVCTPNYGLYVGFDSYRMTRGLANQNCFGHFRKIPFESDNGCTSWIYFDNAGDNVTLMLYNVTLTSQNQVDTITSVIAGKQKA